MWAVWAPHHNIVALQVRAMANSFIICFAFITGFIVAKSFADLIESPLLGEEGTFWLYGGICFVGGIFTLICVPETRNKSIEEIQSYFSGNKSKNGLTPENGLYQMEPLK